MINRFSQFLVEEEKTVYFTFGRLNPPTRGHEMLLNKLAKAAGKNPYRIYLSKSNDPKKNPLSYNDKIKFSRKMYPKHARQIIKDTTITNVMDIATKLYNDGFVNVVMAVDGPRSREFDILLNKYNGQKARHGFYNFKSIKFINVGERNDSSEGIDGVSATKQRNAAKDNDFVAFSQGLPKNVSNADAKALFNAVRKGMGLKEAKDFKNHVQLEPVSELREAYLRDNIFEEGEQVVMTKHGIVGKIKHLGTNYLIVESKGETWRCWLDDVSKVDPNFEPSWEVQDFPNDDNDGVVRESLNESVKPHPEVVKAYKKTIDADDKAADYNHRSNKARVTRAANHLSKKIKQHHPDLDMKGKIALRTHLQNMKEANQPEWGTPESTKKAKSMTPGEKNEGNGLWFNIRKRREAGKPKLKPGDKNYPKSLTPEGAMKRIATTQSNKADRMASTDKKGLETYKKKQEAKQDPDIKDRPGSQPAGYHSGLTKAQKIARDRQFKKQAKMDDDNPAAYKKAPGDQGAKTKLSKHTKKYRQMFGENDNVELAKKRIEREKEMDKKKHDRMMDKARLRDVKKQNMQEYGGPPISRAEYLKQKPMKKGS